MERLPSFREYLGIQIIAHQTCQRSGSPIRKLINLNSRKTNVAFFLFYCSTATSYYRFFVLLIFYLSVRTGAPSPKASSSRFPRYYYLRLPSPASSLDYLPECLGHSIVL